jgi:hypothetical protein
MLAQLQAEQELRAQGRDLTDAQSQAYIRNAGEIAKITADVQRQQAAVEELGSIFGQVSNDIGQGLENAATSGESALHSLRDVGLKVADDLYQAFYQLAVTNPLQNMLTGSNSSTLSDLISGAGSIIEKLFGGGGDYSMGSMNTGTGMLGHAANGGYIQVGENGPEKFYPNVSGTVVPHGVPANSNGCGVSVVVNNYASNSEATTEEQTGPDGRKQIQVFIRDTVKSQISSGAMDKTMDSQFGAKAVPKKRRA